jgi:hypothetical protein
MTLNEIALGPNRQRNTSIGSFGVINIDARDGHPLRVRLMVATEEEYRYTLQPGETFSVGDQTWKLDGVDYRGRRDWTVVLARVE